MMAFGNHFGVAARADFSWREYNLGGLEELCQNVGVGNKHKDFLWIL
jgi:hypothetical protein